MFTRLRVLYAFLEAAFGTDEIKIQDLWWRQKVQMLVYLAQVFGFGLFYHYKYYYDYPHSDVLLKDLCSIYEWVTYNEYEQAVLTEESRAIIREARSLIDQKPSGVEELDWLTTLVNLHFQFKEGELVSCDELILERAWDVLVEFGLVVGEGGESGQKENRYVS